MDRHFGDLIEIMQKEIKLYTELKLLEESKREIIINNDVRALEAITHKEQGFVKTIVQLESLRTQAVDGLCRERGAQRANTLQDLYHAITPFEAKQLEVHEKKLVTAIGDTKAVNDLNEKLIQQSLDYIDVTLSLAQQLGKEDVGYGKSATERAVKAEKGLFDAKV